jgi:hypothetical protein
LQDIRDELASEITGERLPDHDSENLGVLAILRKRVAETISFGLTTTAHSLRDDPPDTPKLKLYPLLLHIRILLLELIGEAERNDRKTLVVELRVDLRELRLASEDSFGMAGKHVRDLRHGRDAPNGLGAMDIGKEGEVAGVFESAGDEPGLGKVVLHDSAVSSEAEVEDWDQRS